MALLELHESRQSVRLHAAHLTQIANTLQAAAQALKDLVNDQGTGRSRATTEVLDALPGPEDVHKAVAQLRCERTREVEAREQAARLDLLD